MLKKHVSRGGLVKMSRLWQELRNLSINDECCPGILRPLENYGLIWFFNTHQIVVTKPWRCPDCGLVREEPSRHMFRQHTLTNIWR